MSKPDKRQQIIDAAVIVMSEKGYEKASIKDIASEAGITPGLVHYYFRNKEEILSDLLLDASKQYTDDMQTLRASVPVEHLANAALHVTKERVASQPEWYRLRYELFALGLRNPSLSPGVDALMENGRNGIAAILSQMWQEPPDDADAMAAVLLACFDGLALQKLLNPDFDLESAYRVLDKMASALKNAP